MISSSVSRSGSLAAVSFCACVALASTSATATPPPEEMPAICVRTICVLVLPPFSSRVAGYSSQFDPRSGKQLLSARFDNGVVITIASSPVSGHETVESEGLSFRWSRKADGMLVGSSCSLCADSDDWKGQALGISVHGDPEKVDSVLKDGLVRVWAMSTRGHWQGAWYDLRLSRPYRVRFP